ncbi:hypothetical protein K438DRAFT_1977146 [Mycena galopus ATCC 62051]|nr:hypothetical protein K438DRAFT_1977146 [Mycena galopus ATCC 62051]
MVAAKLTASQRRATNVKSGTSLSSRIHLTRSSRKSGGRPSQKTLTLSPAEVRRIKEADTAKEAERRAGLNDAQRRVPEARIADIPEPFDADNGAWEDEILRGNAAVEISHAGEAIQAEGANKDLLERLEEEQELQDRVQILVDGFAAQLENMTEAYMGWSLAMAEKGLGGGYVQPDDLVVEDTRRVWVVDLFSAYYQDVPIVRGDAFPSCTYIRHGLMPSVPYMASVVITLRALKVFRTLQLRCPRLGIQAFIRGLCDLHAVPPRSHLGTQFSVSFDVYLAIRAAIDQHVQVALGRNTPNWCLMNACPACMYKLEVQHREDGTAVPGASKERGDNRVAPGDYYLSRVEVDQWAADGADVLMRGFEPGTEEDEGAGCDKRWQNMKEDVTARAWGMYDETGIFPALCRHGFMLVMVEMVKSGELAKYGFSVINHLIRVLGEVAIGVDIGCKTGKMMKAHPQLSQIAQENNFKCLVGSFHGHGHGRLCQVCNLATYVNGMGLEDCEGCESFFSKSNALASTTRYLTVFHRQQAITTYIKHADTCDAYEGLTLVIANKYCRALKIKEGLPALRLAMQSLGVATRDVFETWLAKEKEYLRSLTKEPVQETMEMEYYQKLVNHHDNEERAHVLRGVTQFIPVATDANYEEAVKQTRRLETQHRHALEVTEKSLATVQDLELRLGITTRWVPGGEEWVKAGKMVSSRRFQRALDQLQGLIVARMFELTKVNMSGTGYKLRKHIAKALQVRSKAVKSALERYNFAAAAMAPAKPQLSWQTVVDYAFLADFDLLREGREDIRAEPWALSAGHAAMDQHYKMLRADEEIRRLNLEIPRLVTYIADERDFLVYHETHLREEGNEVLAHQVRRQRMDCERFDAVHMDQLIRLSKEAGFTASLSCGVSVSQERRIPSTVGATSRDVSMPAVVPDRASPPPPTEDDDDGDDDGAAAAEAFEIIVRIAHDVHDEVATRD